MAPTATHRITTGSDGRPVLVKRSADEAGRARLTGEATVLRALSHPGTVRVRDLRHDDEATELHLDWVGPHSLATVTAVPPAEAGRLIARVAATVEDLHRAGVVHGRLTPDHVLLGADGAPVLTGLAEASAHDRDRAADDVAALGALLTSVLRPGDDGPLVPDHRPRRAGSGVRAALLTVADLACAHDPATRPTAGDLAERLRTAAGPGRPHRRSRRRRRRAAPSTPSTPSTATPPGPGGRASPSEEGRRPAPPAAGTGSGGGARSLPVGRPRAVAPGTARARRPAARALRRRLEDVPPGRRVAVAALVLALGGTAVAATALGGSPQPTGRAAPPVTTTAGPGPGDAPEPSTTTVAPRPSTSPPPADAPPGRRSAPRSGACPPVAAEAADVDGDGCPEALRLGSGQVTVAGTTWAVGRLEDALVVADWDCDGRATVASLRPSTGEVFVFDRWAGPDDEVTVEARATVPGATSLRAADPDGDGCAELEVVGPDGATTTVPARERR